MQRAFHIERLMAAIAVAIALLFTLPAGSALAGPPTPAKGRGDKCVAPTDWMRKNHMSVLKHQRDDTVHEGIRTAQFSLKGCIDCHAVKGTDGAPVTVADPKHFCRTCHDYAAVRVDCFDCHASRPGEAGKSAGVIPEGVEHADAAHATADREALDRYLKEAGR